MDTEVGKSVAQDLRYYLPRWISFGISHFADLFMEANEDAHKPASNLLPRNATSKP